MHAALHKPAAAAAALSAVAVIGTDVSYGQQPGSYAVHPAVLDAVTHTAAVFSGASQPADAADQQPAVTRIPAALEAYAASSMESAEAAAGSRKWCSGTLEALQPDGSVVTSFNLDSGVARLAGFQAKVCMFVALITCS